MRFELLMRLRKAVRGDGMLQQLGITRPATRFLRLWDKAETFL